MSKISLKNSTISINKIFSMEEMSADDVKIEVYVHTSRSEHTVHIKKTELQQQVGLRCELIKVMFCDDRVPKKTWAHRRQNCSKLLYRIH